MKLIIKTPLGWNEQHVQLEVLICKHYSFLNESPGLVTIERECSFNWNLKKPLLMDIEILLLDNGVRGST